MLMYRIICIVRYIAEIGGGVEEEEKYGTQLATSISKTNTGTCLKMQISLQLQCLEKKSIHTP